MKAPWCPAQRPVHEGTEHGVDLTDVQPLEPLKALIEELLGRGGTVKPSPPRCELHGHADDAWQYPAGLRLARDAEGHELVLTLDEQRIAEVRARDELILELENQLAAAQPRRDG